MGPPQGFVTISPGIYISLASTNAVAFKQLNDSAPKYVPTLTPALGVSDMTVTFSSVILIFGWMGALTRHLQRYAQKYAELYPHATQIILKCGPSFFWTSAAAQQKRLIPVVEALESLGCLPITNGSTQESTRVRPRVLVHSFSNGGSVQLVLLGRLLWSKYPSIPPSEHLVSALIVDSSPCIGTFRTITAAFSIAIRNPITRGIALAVIYFLHAFRLCLHMVGMKTLGMQFPKMLLRPNLLRWMNAQTPRLYVFSKKDELVPWPEVKEHVEAAKASGLNVRYELYDESAHVAHMRLNPKRYWDSIQDLWQIACRESHMQAVESPSAIADAVPA